MATYYGYAERNAEDQIDWNAIGKSMNDTLLAEQKRRDDLKAQINKDSVEFGETLSNYPEGNHQGMVDSSINYASDIQSYQLLQLRLLKSGKIKLRDYIRNRENLVQGTKQYYGIMEKYSAKFDEFMKLKDEGKTGARQAKLLSEVEGFGNLANTRPYINPTTGEISIGKQMLKDPSKPYNSVSNPYTSQMGSKPADFKTTQQLEFSLLGPQMSYDSSVAIDETVAKYEADYQKLEKSGSSSTKITDITENPNFDASLRSYYNSYFESNPNNAADFLTDFVTQRDVNGTAVPIDYVNDPSNLLADPTKPYNKETNPYVGLMMKPDPAQPGGGRMIADMDSESGKELKEFGFEKFKETVLAQLKKKIDYERGYKYTASDFNTGNTDAELTNNAYRYFQTRTDEINQKFMTPEQIKARITKLNPTGGPTTKELREYAADFGISFMERKNDEGKIKYFVEELEYPTSVTVKQLIDIVQAQAAKKKDNIITGYKRKNPSSGGGMAEFSNIETE